MAFFAVVRFAVVRFAVVRFAVAFLAVVFLAVVRFAVVRFAVVRFAVVRFAVAFLAVAFLAVAFLAVVFLAVVFLAVVFLAVVRFAGTVYLPSDLVLSCPVITFLKGPLGQGAPKVMSRSMHARRRSMSKSGPKPVTSPRSSQRSWITRSQRQTPMLS